MGDADVHVKVDVIEPLLRSPFIFGADHGKQGVYGIQAISFPIVMNGGSAK